MTPKSGDKVRIKAGKYAGNRGVVNLIRNKVLRVRLDGSDNECDVDITDATNFSLAARKAWARMPARRVGRPKGTAKTDRVSVTLRIDRKLWTRFQQAEADGLVMDRSATINAWIANRLNELLTKDD